MDIEFHGAAREVTGSCHIVRANGSTILLDCGLFQGRRADVAKRNRALPIGVDKIDAIVLSHAHIDHAGRLPLLVGEGYRNAIFATKATRDLCEVMLADAAHIQEKDAEFLTRRKRAYVGPLYGQPDVAETMRLMSGQPYDCAFEVAPGVKATFVNAGHILGSASVELECTRGGRTTRLVFSGDIGRGGLTIIRDPVPPVQAGAVIMESTYGNRDHPDFETTKAKLARVVKETAVRGGRVLIPAFAVGRTQELLYALHELVEEGAIPSLPIVIDSPLATRATEVFRRNEADFDHSEPLVRRHHGGLESLFAFPQLRFTQNVEESKALNGEKGPMIVIAASGMAESGRILHHLLNGASDRRNTILVVGFMAEHTLGRRIVEKQPVIRVFGEDVPLHAKVEVINGYSAHADRRELVRWLDAVRATSPALHDVWLVHGETAAQDALSGALAAKRYRVHCPTAGTRATM